MVGKLGRPTEPGSAAPDGSPRGANEPPGTSKPVLLLPPVDPTGSTPKCGFPFESVVGAATLTVTSDEGSEGRPVDRATLLRTAITRYWCSPGSTASMYVVSVVSPTTVNSPATRRSIW